MASYTECIPTFIGLGNKDIANVSEIDLQNLDCLMTFNNNFEDLNIDCAIEFLLEINEPMLESLNSVNGAT
jgi:hypothetical protein